MQTFLPRAELRRQTLATMGMATDGSLNAQVLEQLNAYIDQAAQTVAIATRWKNTEKVASIPIDEGQTFLPYSAIEAARWMKESFPDSYHPATFGLPIDGWKPPGLPVVFPIGPGGILAGAAWDPIQLLYTPLQKRAIPVEASYDDVDDSVAVAKTFAQNGIDYPVDPVLPPQTAFTQIVGGVTLPTAPLDDTADLVKNAALKRDRERARPRAFEPMANGIRLWPEPDTRYVLRFSYTIYCSLFDPALAAAPADLDQFAYPVDALCIILLAAADYAAFQADKDLSARFQARYELRMRTIRGWENAGQSIPLDKECSFAEVDVAQLLPNWDRRTVYPPGRMV